MKFKHFLFLLCFGCYLNNGRCEYVPEELVLPAVEQNLSARQAIISAINQYNHFRYDHALAYTLAAIKVKPDTAPAQDILCVIYSVMNRWDETIEAGEKAYALDKNYGANLLYAYKGAKQWKKAYTLNAEILKSSSGNSPFREGKKEIEKKLKGETYSAWMVAFLLLLMAGLFFARIVPKYLKNTGVTKSGFTEFAFISMAISGILYAIF